MPTGNRPDVYIWGLDKNRMPITLVRLDIDVEQGQDVYLFDIPDVLFDNPDVHYAVPEDILFL